MAQNISPVMFMVTYIMKDQNNEILWANDKLFYTYPAALGYLFEKIYKSENQVWTPNKDAIGDAWDYVCDAYTFTDARGYHYECILKGIPMKESEKN